MYGKVIILVISHKSILLEAEINSLRQLYKILGHYPIKFICPEGLDVSSYSSIRYKIEFDFVDKKWLSNYWLFNRFKLSPQFYNNYRGYKYILFYEPDAWVFKDELEFWCSMEYDYIGAPWFEGWHDANRNSQITGVGNGGFSLRKVKSTYKILQRMKLYSIIYNLLLYNRCLKVLNKDNFIIKRLIKYLDKRRDTGINEDYQIYLLSKVYSWYNIAPVNVALRFSFDVNPATLYKMNNNNLPFGCHGWNRYETEFWEQFIK